MKKFFSIADLLDLIYTIAFPMMNGIQRILVLIQLWNYGNSRFNEIH